LSTCPNVASPSAAWTPTARCTSTDRPAARNSSARYRSVRAFAGLPSGRGSRANCSRCRIARSALNAADGADAGSGDTPRWSSAVPAITPATTRRTTTPATARRGVSRRSVFTEARVCGGGGARNDVDRKDLLR
jgi:hypothetical protein